MKVELIRQSDKQLISVLKNIRDVSSIKIAVAYLSKNGLEEIEEQINNANSVQIICSAHGNVSDIPALRSFEKNSIKYLPERSLSQEIYFMQSFICSIITMLQR